MWSVSEQTCRPTAGVRPVWGVRHTGPRTWDPRHRVEQLVPGWGHQGDGCHPKRATEQREMVVIPKEPLSRALWWTAMPTSSRVMRL